MVPDKRESNVLAGRRSFNADVTLQKEDMIIVSTLILDKSGCLRP